MHSGMCLRDVGHCNNYMWKQLLSPNLAIEYTGGLCLKAVRQAFGINAKHATASDDWESSKRLGKSHAEMAPKGFSVPVHFSLGDEPAGHIAIYLPDGRVASSTKSGTHQGLYIHPDIQDLIDIYARYHKSCTYLGWSEVVEDVAVITAQGGDTMLDELTVRRAVEGEYLAHTGKLPPQSTIDQKVNYCMSVGGFGQFFDDIHEIEVSEVQDPEVVEKAKKYDEIGQKYY